MLISIYIFSIPFWKCSSYLLKKDAAVVCRRLMAVDPEEVHFTLVALTAGEDIWSRLLYIFCNVYRQVYICMVALYFHVWLIMNILFSLAFALKRNVSGEYLWLGCRCCFISLWFFFFESEKFLTWCVVCVGGDSFVSDDFFLASNTMKDRMFGYFGYFTLVLIYCLCIWNLINFSQCIETAGVLIASTSTRHVYKMITRVNKC